MSKESDYFNHQIIKISFLTLFVFVRNVLLFVSRRQNEQGDKLWQRFLFILHLRTHEQSRYISELISEEIRQKATTNTNTVAAHRSSPFLPSFLPSFVLFFFRSLSAGQVGSWRLCSSQFSHCCLPVGKYGSFSSPLTSLTLESPCVSVTTGAEWGSEHTLSACMQIMLLLRGALNWILSAIKILFPEHSSWCITCKEHLH